MWQRNIARSFGCFATPIVATTRVYGCLPTFSQLSCGTTYCQSEAIVVERYRQNITAKIVVAAALVQNATGGLLLVPREGTVRFMLPCDLWWGGHQIRNVATYIRLGLSFGNVDVIIGKYFDRTIY